MLKLPEYLGFGISFIIQLTSIFSAIFRVNHDKAFLKETSVILVTSNIGNFLTWLKPVLDLGSDMRQPTVKVNTLIHSAIRVGPQG